MSGAHLEVAGLVKRFGGLVAAKDISFSVKGGEILGLIGPNGSGKSTVMKSILGVERPDGGSVRIGGTEVAGWPPHRIARLGVGYCPEERGIYASLSAEENLLLPPALGPTAMPIDEIYQMFPNLERRRHTQGTRLSGGEQQMLAVARVLRSGARLLLLDEISEGLAPVIVQQLARTIQELRRRAYTIVMVEQNFRFAAPLADRFYIMEHGRMVQDFTAAQLQDKMTLVQQFLGV
jgi:branched-chain amino acid transport system ATP-binding protein